MADTPVSEETRNYRKGSGFSFSGELRNYVEAFRRYWPLSLSIGFLFGWLLAFPMQGPLFGALVQSRNIDLLPVLSLFLAGHIAGIAAGAVIIYFFRKSLDWFLLGVLPCMAISLLIRIIPPDIWTLFFALMGLFAGLAVSSWVTHFSAAVNPSQRGRTFIIGAVLANVILYIVNLVLRKVEFQSVLMIVSFLPLLATIILLIQIKNRKLEIKNDFEIQNSNETKVHINLPISGTWPIFPFIFAIYAVGGLMYWVIGSVSSPPPTGPLNYYALLPYIFFSFLAGSLADIRGRRINAILGAVCVGIGLMLIGLLKGTPQFVTNQTLLVGGYAFLDTFTWVIAADISSRRSAPLYYSAVLGMNLLAILTGLLLAQRINAITGREDILAVCMAGLFSFISLACFYRLKETLPGTHEAAIPVSQDYLREISQKADFTPREVEIAGLMLAGSSNREILEKLVIAPDTLKTHQRNIYRKAGVRNRLEFTLAVMKTPSKASPCKGTP